MAKAKYYSKSEIIYKGRFNKAVLIDDSLMYLIAGALTKAPAEVVDQTLKECVFYRFSMEKVAGMYMPKILIQGKDLILLSEGLLLDESFVPCEKVLHEVAHHILSHKTFTDLMLQGDGSPLMYERALKIRDENEKEADKLRDKWLDDYAEYQKQQKRGEL